MKKKKGFNAVEFQRKRRREINERLTEDPEGYFDELDRKYPVKKDEDK